MALVNQQQNRDQAVIDHQSVMKGVPAKDAVMFVQALAASLACGYWTSFGLKRAGDRGLITLRDSNQNKVSECSFTTDVTLLAAVREYCNDVAQLLEARTPR